MKNFNKYQQYLLFKLIFLCNYIFSYINANNTNIQIYLNCDRSEAFCDKANKGFSNAANIVSNTFDFKVPILVNASFVNLCESFMLCPEGQPKPIGAASPTRLITLMDDDGVERLYPQSLVKQLQLSTHHEFSDFDITAGFNSKNEIFWFRGDPEIEDDQVDFELVVVHELLHGLGFSFSWDDYLNPDNPIILTPSPSFFNSNFASNDSFFFTGFQEFALDKYLVLTRDNSSLNQITKNLNRFSDIQSNFSNVEEFTRVFSKSPQFNDAKKMFNYSINNETVAFRFTDNEEIIIIETSLVPFRSGSSFSHLDFTLYNNTTDFLMRVKAPRKVTLDDLTSVNGNNINYTNPIGPKTINMLKAIGYVYNYRYYNILLSNY